MPFISDSRLAPHKLSWELAAIIGPPEAANLLYYLAPALTLTSWPPFERHSFRFNLFFPVLGSRFLVVSPRSPGRSWPNWVSWPLSFKLSLMQVENFLMAQNKGKSLDALCRDHDDDARLINFYALIFDGECPAIPTCHFPRFWLCQVGFVTKKKKTKKK